MKPEDRGVHFLIVNFNGSEILDQCLQSILNQKFDRKDMLVVDNGSTDASIQIIRQYAPQVALLELDSNQGYAKATNQGLTHLLETKNELVALINNDVLLHPDWTREMVQFIDFQGYDLAQSIITAYPRIDRIDSLGIGISRHLIIYDRGWGVTLSDITNNSRPIFGPCFAAAIFRREVLDQLRRGDIFLDESYVSFYEDVDFCFRATKLGFRAGLLLKPLCHHRRSFTADRLISKKYYLIGKNYWLLLQKHIPRKWIIRKSLYILCNRVWFWIQSGRSATQWIRFAIGSGEGLISLLFSLLKEDRRLQKDDPNLRKVVFRILEGDYE